MLPALIGYRATGKTTVGQLLASRLGFEFVDTDAEVVKRAGHSIADIFAKQGEPAFRDLESQVVDAMTQRRSIVLSLGGGAVLRSDNRQRIMSRCDPVVWLTASPQTIAKRISADEATSAQRPNLTSKGGLEEVREVLGSRIPLYESCATMTLDSETISPEELAAEIYRSIAGTPPE